MSRVLIISSFPPRHCGIGTYASTQAERLRREGHEVTVVSPPDGAGDIRVAFRDGAPFRVALERGAGFDRIIVHFQPALYLAARSPLDKLSAARAFWKLCALRPRTEVLVHEADPPRWWRPDEWMLRAAFKKARLLFHTRRERSAFARAYRLPERGELVEHVGGVSAHQMDRAEARRRLGLDRDERLLVAPGFIHPDKGLDRVVDAFDGTGRLVLVGSVKDATPANLSYARALRERVGTSPGVELVEGFLDDEVFDAWIAAADAVVLAYRRSWSSGVLARAQLLGTPAVVADVGGLGEQAGKEDTIVADDAELRRAMAAPTRENAR